MALTKKELIDVLYEKIDLPKKDCISLVESVIDIIKDELGKGDKVNISGFGKWVVKSKRERVGRNPYTGKEMEIKARKVVTFHSSPVLRNAVNGQ